MPVLGWPFVLEGEHVTLRPLHAEHVSALSEVGSDPEIWRWMPPARTTERAMRDWIGEAHVEERRGRACPFTIFAGKDVAGSTRFGAIELAHGRVEIGWTWITPAWQRSAVNTEMKLLMLTHAFESWSCRRVELKTDTRNARSRAAMLRIGAREEGTLRKHQILPDGGVRDTVYYSILDDEWPDVRRGLLEKLGRTPCEER